MAAPNIWAEIDLDAIDHNVRELRRITHPRARMMAVVKADGYGHGAVEVARTVLAAGADMLAVARIDEAIGLRQAGLDAPILVFSPTSPDFAANLIAHDLIQGVTGLAVAQQLDAVAQRYDKRSRFTSRWIPAWVAWDCSRMQDGWENQCQRWTRCRPSRN